jgi:uncharacterized SAM-binding protein YcdF (DUF218 family)
VVPIFVTVKSVARTLLLPPAGPALLAIAGAWLLGRRRAGGLSRRVGIGLVVCGLGSLWLLSLPVVADVLERAAEREPVLDEARAADAQAIVILGGGTARPSAPEFEHAPMAGADLLERLAYGAYLARRTRLPILVSGDLIEAEAMHISLGREFGVATRWIESHSYDTFQNAQFSAPLLRESGVRRILLVTSATHEYRAAREFEACGLEVIPAPTGVWTPPPEPGALHYLPNVAALQRSTGALYELIGDVARRLFAASHLRRHTS